MAPLPFKQVPPTDPAPGGKLLVDRAMVEEWLPTIQRTAADTLKVHQDFAPPVDLLQY